MNPFSNKVDETRLDEAIAAVAQEPIDEQAVQAAAARVWAKLSQEGAVGIASDEVHATAAPAPHPHPATIHGCADFQSLIPAFVAGELPPARALLVEDHTRSCIPCRRALREAREGKRVEAKPVVAAPSRVKRPVLYALAAMLVAALGAGLFFAMDDYLRSGGQMARVEAIEGSLYRIDAEASQPIGAGAAIQEGEEIRTAKGSRAFVRMTDGSVIEMSERAGLSLDAARKGNTIRLEGGRIIVQAAKQRPRHLYVETDDALVSVTGTIFAVNHGTKGSRVAVVEGEVRVQQNGREDILHPGRQVTTNASLSNVPVADEVAWSRNAEQYERLLAELTAAGQEIDAQVERPGLRYSTRLLDLSPEGTRVFVGLPNLARNLGETQALLDRKLEQSELLRQWWQENFSSPEERQKVHDLIEELSALGRDLGPEIAVAVTKSGEAEPEPVLLAEVENETAFRSILTDEVARWNERGGERSLRIVDSLPAVSNGHELLLYIGNGLFVASPSAALLGQVAGNAATPAANPFLGTAFHDRVADSYRDGAGWLFSADLATLIGSQVGSQTATAGASEERRTAEMLGVLDLDQFTIDRREVGDRTETRAALTFKQARRGIAAWLAEPAPMRSLDFVSPEANLAAAFVVKSPASLLDELLAANTKFAAELAKAEAKDGFNLRNDVAAPLGGEFALALDGPLLPKPSWKFVAEVYDQSTLERTIERTVERLNRELVAKGKQGITLATEEAGGRTWHSITSADLGVAAVYAFDDGFLVAGPSRALVERAFAQRESGSSLGQSDRLRNLLGQDGQVNVSALVFEDFAKLAAQGAKFLPKEATRRFAGGDQPFGFFTGHGPGVVYAYAETDRILFASNADNGPLGANLKTLEGFSSVLRAIGGHGGSGND